MAESTRETPVLDLMASMTADSIEASSLDSETLMLVRIAALAAVGYCGPITLELEDAPGASHWTHMREATPEFDQEMRRGMAYLRERAAELDITIS